MNPLAALLTYGGLAALALAMKRHYRAAFGAELPSRGRLALRATGWLLLACSLPSAVRAQGPEVGPIAWFALVACAGFTVTFVLAYAPRLWPVPLAASVCLMCVMS